MVKIKDMVHVEKQENSNRLIQVTRELLCKVPQDIDSASPAKNIPIGSKSPKVDNPSSPQTDKTMTESSKPLSPQSPTGAKGAPTSPTHVASSCDAAGNSPRPEPTESSGRPQLGEGSSVPQAWKATTAVFTCCRVVR
jgi:hypothetical protein